jgi:hypothetical protein
MNHVSGRRDLRPVISLGKVNMSQEKAQPVKSCSLQKRQRRNSSTFMVIVVMGIQFIVK